METIIYSTVINVDGKVKRTFFAYGCDAAENSHYFLTQDRENLEKHLKEMSKPIKLAVGFNELPEFCQKRFIHGIEQIDSECLAELCSN